MYIPKARCGHAPGAPATPASGDVARNGNADKRKDLQPTMALEPEPPSLAWPGLTNSWEPTGLAKTALARRQPAGDPPTAHDQHKHDLQAS